MSMSGQRENTLCRFTELKELSQRRSSCPLWLQHTQTHTHTHAYTLKAILLHLVTFIPFSPPKPTPPPKVIHNIQPSHSHQRWGTHSSSVRITHGSSSYFPQQIKLIIPNLLCQVVWSSGGLSLILSFSLRHRLSLRHKPQKDWEPQPTDPQSKNINKVVSHKDTYSFTAAEVHAFLCEKRTFFPTTAKTFLQTRD